VTSGDTRTVRPQRPRTFGCAPKPFLLLRGYRQTASADYSMRELGRHSVCAPVGAQSVVINRRFVVRLDARSTSMNQSEATPKTSLNSTICLQSTSGRIIAQAASR